MPQKCPVADRLLALNQDFSKNGPEESLKRRLFISIGSSEECLKQQERNPIRSSTCTVLLMACGWLNF